MYDSIRGQLKESLQLKVKKSKAIYKFKLNPLFLSLLGVVSTKIQIDEIRKEKKRKEKKGKRNFDFETRRGQGHQVFLNIHIFSFLAIN